LENLNISNNQIKQFRLLKEKKYRQESAMFLVEGQKMIEEALRSVYILDTLICTSEWAESHRDLTKIFMGNLCLATSRQIEQISNLNTPQSVLGVLKIPHFKIEFPGCCKELCLFLDSISDPGNLGTILRLADWFGIEDVFCNLGTVDLYNPKVVQATMGSIFRVKVHYIDGVAFLNQYCNKSGNAIYGASLQGENIFQASLDKKGLIVLGNESTGISKEIEGFIDKKIFIPSYPEKRNTAESLNVSVAAAIICSEFRRRNH